MRIKGSRNNFTIVWYIHSWIFRNIFCVFQIKNKSPSLQRPKNETMGNNSCSNRHWDKKSVIKNRIRLIKLTIASFVILFRPMCFFIQLIYSNKTTSISEFRVCVYMNVMYHPLNGIGYLLSWAIGIYL